MALKTHKEIESLVSAELLALDRAKNDAAGAVLAQIKSGKQGKLPPISSERLEALILAQDAAAAELLEAQEALAECVASGERRRTFAPDLVGHYFDQTDDQLALLRRLLPPLYQDFHDISIKPGHLMHSTDPTKPIYHFTRSDVERLERDIDQIFEIRANSELASPSAAYAKKPERVFITHGRSNDWREVQAYVEKDIKLETMELAQEASLGRKIIEKLEAGAQQCDSAVIVMTGDDIDASGQAKARENVMHEIGYFQGVYGRARVVVLHEEGVSIPTNLSRVLYIPFPKNSVGAGFGVLFRELNATYKK